MRIQKPIPQRPMAGSYAHFPKALLRLSPSDFMTRSVFLYSFEGF